MTGPRPRTKRAALVSGRRRIVWVVLAISLLPRPARAQSSTLFLEVLRDPGAASTPRTARGLALGGVETVSTGASDAAAHPAGLLQGPAIEVLASFGAFRAARDEFAATPARLPTFEPGRRTGPTSTVPAGLAAAAVRTGHWAVAGFVDTSDRFAHEFATDDAVLYFAALQGTSILEEGSATATMDRSTLRLGGAVAAGNRAGTAGLGLSVSAVRLSLDARASYTTRATTTIAGGPPMQSCCVHDDSLVTVEGWGMGVTLSGTFTPIPLLTVAGAWRHEPSFDGVREWRILDDRGGSSRTTSEVTFRLPSVIAGSLTLRPGTETTLAAELARERYAGTYSPLADAGALAIVCGTIVAPCGGWNFLGHDTADVTVVRVGGERRIPVGNATLAIRGGLAHRPAYTLARRADDPTARPPESLPHPPTVTAFEPPRLDEWTWSAGAAIAGRSTEVGAGVGFGRQTMRFLVDVRFRSR